MTSAKRSAVCCLSSLNLDKFDEWKDTRIVEDLVRFLDNVLEYFVRTAPKQLHKAIYSASKERAIGIGTLGYVSYLQSKMIPFESGGFNSAVSETHKIYSLIKERAVSASLELGSIRGEAPDCRGSGMRNSHLLAIAPNASSSHMVGVSPSIEPYADLAFLDEGRAGSFLVKNHRLKEKLQELGLDTEYIWDRIKKEKSLKDIKEIPDDVKEVFKTFVEIDPKWVIELAAIRQEYVCQAQSVNIKVHKDITMQEMMDIHIMAWSRGLKSLYYCRAESPTSVSVSTTDVVQPLNRVKVDVNFEQCLSCEG